MGDQYVGSFSFNQCVSKGQIFLNKNNWNRLIRYINDAYDEGSRCDASEYGIDSDLPSSDSNDYMTAEMFNKVAAAITRLDSSKSLIEVSVGDVIYGSYFEDLEYYADYLKYKYHQCDRCDMDCNVSCDTCNSCNGSSQAVYCCSSCNNGEG